MAEYKIDSDGKRVLVSKTEQRRTGGLDIEAKKTPIPKKNNPKPKAEAK